MLDTWARSVAGVAGIGSAGLGAWSVFMNTNQAGSAALLLFGALFTLMSLSGRVPDRISKDGVEHLTTAAEQATAETVTELLESPEARAETAETVMKNWAEKIESLTRMGGGGQLTDVSDRNIRLAREILLEEGVRAALDADFSVQASPRPARAVDLTVSVGDGKRVGVEVRLGGQHQSARLRSLAQRFGELVASGTFHAIVIVLAQQSDSSLSGLRVWPRVAGVKFVVVNDAGMGTLSPEDARRVCEAVRSALDD